MSTNVDRERPTKTQVAPSLANLRAMAAPIPRLPPVIRTFLCLFVEFGGFAAGANGSWVDVDKKRKTGLVTAAFCLSISLQEARETDMTTE